MHKIEVIFNPELNENICFTKLDCGLNVYVCQKKGFNKKIGMFGTKYGSLTTCFVDPYTEKRVIVPDGVAHFLEHKLFEKEGCNALDLFSKIGVDSNAYTTFDHTVFYFQTADKLSESVKMLIKLIKEPYFTDENVEKEKGIIAQEISMYNDDQSYITYFNTIKAMYQKNNIKTDILGTVDSINTITKEDLYTCYNTFYDLSNMFFILVGDIEVEENLDLIENELKKYNTRTNKIDNIKRINYKEPYEISQRKIISNMDIFMPQICVGFKFFPVCGDEIIKRGILADIVADMYFSKSSDFFQREYEKGILNDRVGVSYEAEDSFGHVIFSAESLYLEKLEKDLINYILEIKKEDIDVELFENIKNNKIGGLILSSDNISNSYRRIIDSILTETNPYDDIEILKNINVGDLKNFLNNFGENNMVVSITQNKQ